MKKVNLVRSESNEGIEQINNRLTKKFVEMTLQNTAGQLYQTSANQ